MSKWLYSAAFACAAGGLLLGLWPLSVTGVVLAALCGRWIVATGMALVLDLAWGPPVGELHLVYLPLTVCALVCALARYFLAGYFLDRTPPDTL
jgi:hypothetical protein